MKIKIILFLVLVLSNASYAHKEWVHQWVTWEAYKFLNLQVGGDYQDLKNHVGIGFFGIGDPDKPWETGFIGVGAWLEDDDDVVYGVGETGYGWHQRVHIFGMQTKVTIIGHLFQFPMMYQMLG
jgi:hypothetical protein